CLCGDSSLPGSSSSALLRGGGPVKSSDGSKVDPYSTSPPPSALQPCPATGVLPHHDSSDDEPLPKKTKYRQANIMSVPFLQLHRAAESPHRSGPRGRARLRRSYKPNYSSDHSEGPPQPSERPAANRSPRRVPKLMANEPSRRLDRSG